jgi:hypothetical protein
MTQPLGKVEPKSAFGTLPNEEKFDKRYFELNYHIKDFYKVIYKDVIHRNEDSSGESQNFKEPCLRACLTHFIGEDLTGTKSIAEHFVTDQRLHRDHLKRCCCSEEVWRTDDEGTRQRVSIWHAVVTHKLTKLSFIVGSVCFKKLFVDAEDADTFFKETCKYCGEIVAKRADDRPNLCNQKCAKNFEEREKRNAEYAKRPFKKIAYTHYVPISAPTPDWQNQTVYENCAECDEPKYNEKQRKCKLCYHCYKNQSSIGSLSIS